MSTKHSPSTTRIQRRLERWELDHLRQHAADLAERLEATEQRLEDTLQRLSRAEDVADSWREEALQMQMEAADAAGGAPGLTIGGQLVIVAAVPGGLHA